MTPITIRLRELRTAKGWTQEVLATRSGVRRVTISRIENEQTKGVDFDTLERLAKALGCDPGYLIVKKGK
jgi:transcriptional regulator with XRE-family HTH domain